MFTRDNKKTFEQGENSVILNAAYTVLVSDVFQENQPLDISCAVLAIRLSRLASLVCSNIKNENPQMEAHQKNMFRSFLRNLNGLEELADLDLQLEGSPDVEPEQTGK